MSVKIRLKRFGTKKRPYYRVVVMDSKTPRDGRTIEEVGLYHPIEAEDRQVKLDPDKIRYWLDKGAQPSDTVKKLLNKNNIFLN
ncbi:MAG: 30S ribosomal protein S16 [Spirochaetaceae bacterium]|nr:30S ribosomal protein S16 [Spirochaetaceae bacterium]